MREISFAGCDQPWGVAVFRSNPGQPSYNADVYSKFGIAPMDLFKMERITSIVRVRAKIQNEYRLFPPSDEVRRHRRSIEDDMKEAAVDDKPERNIVFVFADETGKTGDFVIVAAVWVLDGSTLVKTSHAISSWQATSPWASGEIHFADFKKHHVDALPGYLDLINRNRQFLSFKTINTEREKNASPAA